MDNILYIHIGCGKCGTTAIQNFLSSNQKFLKEKGLDYIDLFKEYALLTKKDVPKEHIKNGLILTLMYAHDWRTEKRQILWEIIYQALKENNVIISDECLSDFDNIEFKGMMQELHRWYDNIKIIYYIRRQDLFAEAWWNQHVKKNLESRNFIDFVANFDRGDYKNRIDTLEKIFGRENILLRIYEKDRELAEGSLIKNFLKTIGISETNDPTFSIVENVNPRNMKSSLFVKKYFNYLYEKHCSKENPIVSKYISQMEDENCTYERTGYFTKSQRKQYMEKFETDNEIIALKYFDRKNLFFDNNLNIEKVEDNLTDRERKIIEAFTKVIIEIGCPDDGNSIYESFYFG